MSAPDAGPDVTRPNPLAAMRQRLTDDEQAGDEGQGKPIPVLLSHLLAYVLAVALCGGNVAVWANFPGGIATVITVGSLLIQTAVQGGAAWLAHSRVRPIPTETGRHAAP